jgi:hypothetical protein
MKRSARLQSAQTWLAKYEEKNIVRAYWKHFGVSCLCAALELNILGYNISPELIEQFKKEELAKQRKRLLVKEKAREKELDNSLIEENERFSYIAGYTEGGFAFGVEREGLWDGYEYLKREEKDEKGEEDFELPF